MLILGYGRKCSEYRSTYGQRLWTPLVEYTVIYGVPTKKSEIFLLFSCNFSEISLKLC